jgi:hypothetical protein
VKTFSEWLNSPDGSINWSRGADAAIDSAAMKWAFQCFSKDEDMTRAQKPPARPSKQATTRETAGKALKEAYDRGHEAGYAEMAIRSLHSIRGIERRAENRAAPVLIAVGFVVGATVSPWTFFLLPLFEVLP